VPEEGSAGNIVNSFEEMLKVVNAENVAAQITEVASELATNIGEVDKFRYNNSIINRACKDFHRMGLR